MYSVFYKLYFYLKRKEKYKKVKNAKQSKISSLLFGIIEQYYNIFFKKWCIKHPRTKIGVNKLPREKKIIVSLTSFPKRINTVWLTIETLLRQSVKPDSVILWLAASQFDGLNSLPKELLKLQDRGLTIRFCDDLRSHKKYFYVMQEYPNDLIVLADDDMFYPTDTIKKLIKLHKQYPNDICTITCQVITDFFESQPSSWRNPEVNEKFEHSGRVQVFTGSGSLYPPNCLDKSAFNKSLIEELCPNADDLWLTFMALKNNTKITALYPWRAFPITIYGTSENSLWYINSEDGQNNIQWRNLLNYFKEQ